MPAHSAGRPPGKPRSYDRVEGLHLRQWALRPVPFVAALLTNGAGVLDVAWLPRIQVEAWAGAAAWLAGAGAALVALAAVIRVAAKGVLVRKTTLTTGGVYARCRHPFYLANLTGAVGTFLLAGPAGAAAAAIWLLIAGPVYRVTIRGEEAGLAALYPDAWDAYADRVPALLPRPGRHAEGAPVAITWGHLVREREPPRLLRFLGGALLVAGLAHPSRSPLLWAAAACFAVSYVLPLVTGRGRSAE